MALSKKSKIEVYQFLKEKILRKIADYDLSDEDSAKPFQYALFTKKGYLAKGFIHGCETALGSWHESVAKIIAKENFKLYMVAKQHLAVGTNQLQKLLPKKILR